MEGRSLHSQWLKSFRFDYWLRRKKKSHKSLLNVYIRQCTIHPSLKRNIQGPVTGKWFSIMLTRKERKFKKPRKYKFRNILWWQYQKTHEGTLALWNSKCMLNFFHYRRKMLCHLCRYLNLKTMKIWKIGAEVLSAMLAKVLDYIADHMLMQCQRACCKSRRD